MAPRRQEDGLRAALRALVRSFPPLRLALAINDYLCMLLGRLGAGIVYTLKKVFQCIIKLLGQLSALLYRLVPGRFRQNIRNNYQRLTHASLGRTKGAHHRETDSDENDLARRSITYYGTILMAIGLYVFVYIVLVKHHTLLSVSVAILLLLAYLLVIGNSHQIRSILMLCLPIMFTNRGRALIFCYMLGTLAGGPIQTTQENVRQLHSSLQCCKQYLVLEADRQLDQKVVSKLIKAEEILLNMVEDLKKFGAQLKEKLDSLLAVALQVEQVALRAVEELQRMANICAIGTKEIIHNCLGAFIKMISNCRALNPGSMFSMCDTLKPVANVCKTVVLPSYMCRLPRIAIDFVDQTVGNKLRLFYQLIENEFYVQIDIRHEFNLTTSKTKDYTLVAKEIERDIEQKFWYVHLVRRAFNLVSLVLVIWILLTATLYHMHYLSELNYDNIYLDHRLRAYASRAPKVRDELAPVSETSEGAAESQSVEAPLIDLHSSLDQNSVAHTGAVGSLDGTVQSVISDEEILSMEDLIHLARNQIDLERETVRSSSLGSLESFSGTAASASAGRRDKQRPAAASRPKSVHLFPLTRAHERQYLKPFGFAMGQTEVAKLRLAGLVWLVICGYIFFFILVDYSLYTLLDLTVELLREILFSNELPVVSVASSDGAGQIVRYNRTYLRSLRAQSLDKINDLQQNSTTVPRDSNIGSLYRRAMDSLERNIPHDVELLDSFEECLPKPRQPIYDTYQLLLYMALVTLGAVVLEAYALRLRHWVANLFYPERAKQRVKWLHDKMIKEKPTFERAEKHEEFERNEARKKRHGRRERVLTRGVDLIANKVARKRQMWPG